MTSLEIDLAHRWSEPRVLGLVASAATIVTIVGVIVALFFNPLWITFEQQRSGVPALTGYTAAQVSETTNAILKDVLIGPPVFAVEVAGQAVLDPSERSHMVDVYNVLRIFLPVVVLAGIAAAAIVVANRRAAWVWRAVARGGIALTVAGVAIGGAILFFFDAAFLLFHELFFPQGNFMFDPRTQRLPLLFPDQFWTETSAAIALAGVVVALMVWVVARRRAATLPS